MIRITACQARSKANRGLRRSWPRLHFIPFGKDMVLKVIQYCNCFKFSKIQDSVKRLSLTADPVPNEVLVEIFYGDFPKLAWD